MTELEKKEILSHTANGETLSQDLKSKLLQSIKKGEPSIFETKGNYLCCDLGINQPDRYQWITFEDCRALGGSAADNSMCGH